MNSHELHDKAMSLIDSASLTKIKDSMYMALAFEQESALLAREEKAGQPTESVLFKSATWLAIECGFPYTALRLIEEGLKNNPPLEIAEELSQAKKEALKLKDEYATNHS